MFAWEFVNMVVTSRCFAFRALITQARICKRFWVEKLSKFTYLPISSSVETWKIYRNMLCQFLFAWADILSEKTLYFGKHFFCKTKTDYVYKRRVQDFTTVKNFSFNQCSKQERFAFFFSGKLFYKSNRKLFFLCLHILTVGRILDSYANPQLRFMFAQLSR